MKKMWGRLHAKFLVNKKIRFISLFHAKRPGKYCWADCVAWAYNSGRFNPYRIDKSVGCEFESLTHDSKMCYCGGWNNGKCWDSLSTEEKDKVIAENKIELPEGVPF